MANSSMVHFVFSSFCEKVKMLSKCENEIVLWQYFQSGYYSNKMLKRLNFIGIGGTRNEKNSVQGGYVVDWILFLDIIVTRMGLSIEKVCFYNQ